MEKAKINGKILKEKAREEVGKFKKEFKKEINTAILAAFGFLIALVWKDVITSVVDDITKEAHVSSALVSALIVTAICVVGIMISSRLLKNREDENNGNIKK